MTTTSPAPTTRTLERTRVRVQRFGSFLSNMILPNIAAFIAWGIITALFIPTGWAPNEALSALVEPLLKIVIPALIAYTGGRMVYGNRGGVVGVIAAMGVVIGGAPDVMILGAMVAGPLAAWLLKTIERLWQGRVPSGFEMLVDNFSAGILGFVFAMGAWFGLTPVIRAISDGLGAIVGFLFETGLLPLMSILVEPAKVLFLNNAINHGVFTPLGAEQVAETGKSLLFLVEANPGPGAGLLLAITVFGVGAARATAPGAFIIQFFGGIHEVYFPYVIAKPALVLALILGGGTGVLTNVLFDSGLRAPASPGSIIAVLGQTAQDSYVGVVLSVVLSAAVTFAVATLILLASRKRDLANADGDFAAAIAQTQANKGRSSDALAGLALAARGTGAPISNVVFACDAGMGSSALGAGLLRKKIEAAGITGVTVTNRAIVDLDGDADLVITQRELTPRAEGRAPGAVHVSVDTFVGSPVYDEVVDMIAARNAAPA